MNLVETGQKIVNFFNNIKIIITSFLDFLPTEISGILITALILVVAFFIYKVIR